MKHTKAPKMLALARVAIPPIICSLALYACDSSNAVIEDPDARGTSSSGGQASSGSASGGGDSGPPITFDAGLDDAGKPKDCFDPPFTSHFQIINGCSNADKIDRQPRSSKIFADGGVPKP